MKKLFTLYLLFPLMITSLSSFKGDQQDTSFLDFNIEDISQEDLNAKLEFADYDYSSDLATTDEPYFSRQIQFNQIDFEISDEENAHDVSRGEGVKIAVIDTRPSVYHYDLVDENGISIFSEESALVDTVIEEDEITGETTRTYTTITRVTDTEEGYDVINENATTSQHGTLTMGTIGAQINGILGAGIAPYAEIVAIALENYSVGELYAAFEYCIAIDVDIISLSMLIYSENWTESDGTQHYGNGSIPYTSAYYVNRLIENDIILVASAGNDSTDLKAYPAATDGVVSVGAISSTSTVNNPVLAAYSNYSYTTVVAPGTVCVPVVSYGTGDEGSNEYDLYDVVQGTSFSAPIVAGALALYKSINPDAGYEEMYAAITETAIDLSSEGYDDEFGYGQLSISSLLGYEYSKSNTSLIVLLTVFIVFLLITGIIVIIIVKNKPKKKVDTESSE